MKDFFKMFFASVFGVFVATFLIGLILITTILGMIANSGSPAYKPKKNTVLEINLSGTISDRVMENPLAALYGTPVNQQSLVDIKDGIKKAKEDDNIKGIYLKGGFLSAGISSVESIRESLEDFRESGKFIVAYGGTYSQNAYYLASCADVLMLNPQGMVDLHGLATVPLFYTGLLEKLGIKVEVFKVGTFKSAVEPFMLKEMSDANREQVQSYMGSLWNNISKNISGSRNISQEEINRLVDEGLLLKGSEFMQQNGLVDTLMYSTEASDYIKDLLGIERKEKINVASIKDLTLMPPVKNKNNKEKIAVLFAEGEITEKNMSAFNTSSVISDSEYVKELRKLKDNEDVKAVVFRVNSPGGSAYMSEQIWKEVTEIKKVKPIVVSMGDYAASGGYYISCGADYIVAEPTTITGSIGIFGILPTFEGLMNKVGLSTDVEKTNHFSDFGNLSRSLNNDEKRLFQQYIETGYDTFLSRCAEGRGKSKAEIDSVGQGRVWTGEQALQLGLVDELGGIEKAILIAAQKAGLENYTVTHHPEQKDFFTLLLEESFGEMKSKIVEDMMSEAEFRHFSFLRGLDAMDPVQARLPFDIEIR